MTTMKKPVETAQRCDACAKSADIECGCRRCQSEPEDEERFHACKAHQNKVGDTHARALVAIATIIVAVGIVSMGCQGIEMYGRIKATPSPASSSARPVSS